MRLSSHILSSVLYVSIAAFSCWGAQTLVNNNKCNTLRTTEEQSTFSPARYVRIFEDTGSKKILLYDPGFRPQDKHEQREALNSSRMIVDGRSTILIQVAPDLMDENVPMNRLILSATLGRRDGKPPKELEVVGYSEVGKAQEGAQSQKAVSLQTGANVQRTLLNLFFTTEDIINTLYGKCCARELALNPRHTCSEAFEKKKSFNNLVKARFRLYLPEITAITDFFMAEDTARVAGILGSEAFDIDIPSLQAIMQKYKADVNALYDQDTNDAKREAAREDLVERTKIFWHDFSYIEDEINVVAQSLGEHIDKWDKMMNSNASENYSLANYIKEEVCCLDDEEEFNDVRRRYRSAKNSNPRPTEEKCGNEIKDSVKALRTDAIRCYTDEWARDIAEQLKTYLVPGQIFLSADDVKPGDMVILRIEAKESAGTSIGIPAQFQFKIRDRRTRVAISPSLLFVKRLYVQESDIVTTNPNLVKPVNFSPFPGVTFGATFHSRGLKKVSSKPWGWEASSSRRSRFLGALAPGIGANVTFINFGDPRDFDPAANMGTGAFSTIKGSNFEVGAGVVGSIFNNNIQFTYGFNLNADRKRAYFGIGFGFIELGKRFSTFISQ